MRLDALLTLLNRISLGMIFQRLLWGIPVLIAVITIAFIVMRFAPGGPFEREKPLPPAIKQALRAQYKLDRPMLPIYLKAKPKSPEAKEYKRFEQTTSVAKLGSVRLVLSPSGMAQTQLPSYFLQILSGDFGVSMKYQQVRVNDILARTFPVSIILGFLAFVLTYALGITLGLLAAFRKGTWLDTSAMITATLGLSMPNFVLGAILILVFSLWWKLLPPALWEGPSYMILPALTLAIGPATYIARLTRSGVLDALEQEYIRTAHAKGLHERRVLLKHALINALGPLITVSGPLFATLVTGSFVVEHIFAIPGMGRYFISAVIDRDYPMIMAVTIIYATLVVLANILVDVLYAVADPRIDSQ